MAYVPRCIYDVFLSYAHEDNTSPGGVPWVDGLKQRLETALRTQLGIWRGERRAAVWQDRERLKPGYSLSESIREAIGQSAAVVSLYSPSYRVSAYCGEERKEFKRRCGASIRYGPSSRLINVIIGSDKEVEKLVSGDDLHARLSGPGGPLRWTARSSAVRLARSLTL